MILPGLKTHVARAELEKCAREGWSGALFGLTSRERTNTRTENARARSGLGRHTFGADVARAHFSAKHQDRARREGLRIEVKWCEGLRVPRSMRACVLAFQKRASWRFRSQHTSPAKYLCFRKTLCLGTVHEICSSHTLFAYSLHYICRPFCVADAYIFVIPWIPFAFALFVSL
jgi:hypothetical protein